MTEKIENKDICKNCGGMCCKKSGCDYIPNDFTSLSFNDLFNKLHEGNISIVAMLKFSNLKSGKMIVSPFLYLRARNTNRKIVDLLSFKTQCSMLGEFGCTYSYEERPSGGINLVPDKDGMCYPLNNPLEMMKQWEKYQQVLTRCVKRFTGNTVQEQLQIDVQNLLEDIYNENFEGVSSIELNDISSILHLLVQIYPEEFEKIKNKKIKSYNKKNNI